jgi:hypothetical protein
MKRLRILVSCIVFLGFLVIPSAILSYDSSSSNSCIVPECIWAPATGGGTWVTEIQITVLGAGTVVDAWFYFSGGWRTVYGIWTSPGTHSCIQFSNILSTLQSRDSGFTYYGKVGTLWLYSSTSGARFHVQARTVNGNYGKTLPGLSADALGNSAALGRIMMILGLKQNAAYRTFVGVFNSSVSNINITVLFVIFDSAGYSVGWFEKTFVAGGSRFLSFNPFAEAGVASGTYDNCWLYIRPTSGDEARGLFCFGSSANNYTNDTSAHLAVQYQ